MLIAKKSLVERYFLVLFLFVTVNFISAQCPTAPGDQVSYGTDSWIGYVYNAVNTSNPPTNLFTTTYRGYITQSAIFNQDLGYGTLSGTNLCGTYSDQFSIRYKMTKNFPAGNYSFEVGGDDGYRLSFDGGATFPISNLVDHSYTTTTATYYLSGNVNLVLEYYEQGGISRVSFSYANCSESSTAPTSISGTSNICSSSSTSLTAIGGTNAFGSVYQWGTGSTIGSNIISGATSQTITVSPTTTTTYWVRKIDPAPCSITTSGVTQTVTVNTLSTAPTSITGTNTICYGNSTTLTATGGTVGTNSNYQWGTGTVIGSNIISGQTGASITVTPLTNTTYWVRRVDAAPCSNTTTAATLAVNVTIPSGDQVSYGTNQWIGYVYNAIDTSNPPTNAFSTNYRGYITQTETFDQDLGSGSISGPNLCGTYANQFSIRFKMTKNLTAGYYTFTVGGDDGYRLSVDGGASFIINRFYDQGYTTASSATIYLSGTTNFVLEYYEQGGLSRVSFSYTACTNFSTAPTSISGSTSLCSTAGGTTLTAIGGNVSSNVSYQWGTGSTVGSNIIAGQTNASIYINPTTTTTYWVRRVDGAPCNQTTSGITVTVTVSTQSTQPSTITGTANICEGSSTTLTASGGTHGTGAVYQWGTGYSAGVNIISGATSSSITVSPTVQTGYWVRRIDPAPCNTQTGHTTFTVNVTTRSTAPTSISGNSTLCNNGSGTTLTAIGGTTGSSGNFQWGTGTTIGSNIISGQTSASIYVNPTTTTTYWVRRYDAGNCNQATSGVTLTVTVSQPSTAPTTISGTTSICAGSSTTLTVSGGTHGTGATYQWGTGWTVGSNIISGATSSSISVSPTTNTVYWVRRIDPSPCNTSTSGVTTTVNVTNPSTAPTSITGGEATACYNTSRVLAANGATLASGANYQWGIGTVIGSNVISGQTGASITVNPSTTTTYWVRVKDNTTPCTAYTAGISTTVVVTTPPGNPASFGNNTWNVYGYNNADLSLVSAIYAGYYTNSAINFDTKTGTNSWSDSTSPSSASGWSGCPVQTDYFTIVAKRKGFPCGKYSFIMNRWDDAIDVYINGTLVWSSSAWSGSIDVNTTIGSFTLDSTSEIEIRMRENSGVSSLKFTLTDTNISSTAPTAISGNTSICGGSSTTLTASGGTTGTTGVFEWGTGSVVGSNIIAGQTAASITVNPSATTTYWVRRYDSLCGVYTTGVTTTVTTTTSTVAGTLSTSATTICKNTQPSAITLSGNTGSVLKWQYASDSGFTTGVTDIASTSTTLTSAQMGTISATRYYRAVVQNGICSAVNTTPIEINVPAAVTYNGTSWSATPNSTTPVIINGNLTLSSNLNVCSCQVSGGATVRVNSGTSLVIQNDLTVDASSSLIFEDTASLVQISDTAVNSGNIIYKRKTTPLKQYDYTYWSAPVANQALSVLGSPSLFYSFSPTINNWAYQAASTVMQQANGYISRAPNNLNYTTPQILEVTFNGTPNNGVITAPIIKGSGTYNLIGNPYPSAIDIDKFLLDAANTGIINGTVYLWTHNTAISSSIPGNDLYNYTRDDYAKYNITGGVKTASTAVSGGVEPNGKIAAGQGFFIEANSSLANGSYTATFKNSMRISGQNNQFFKIGQNNNGTTEPVAGAIQKNRIWLNISNTQGAYDEMLVGYITGATNDFDNLFDGKTFPAGNVVSLYSILGADKYAIQGRSLPFVDTDVVPVGYSCTISGNFSINLEKFDGLFNNQNVYLLDKSTNQYHDLKESGFEFSSEAGTFNDRFEIHYTPSSSLGIDNPTHENSVNIIKSGKHIYVETTINSIDKISVYDLIGKQIYTKKDINNTTFNTSDFNIGTQVVIVKVTLDNGEIITKKLLMN
ncbi:T9SS sorting signal type C domain-containing protein [Flavobacterium sp.]|uniref:T9SS sorting signal type C domain-containing protein n=1 Tax=Flavobacterium sp. TaxID=239 RepID=UPI0035B260EA